MRADGICRQARRSLAVAQDNTAAALRANQGAGTPAGRANVGNVLRKGVAVAARLLGRLRALTPPLADRAAVASYLRGLSSQVDLLTQFATAIAVNDSRVITLNQQLQQGKSTVQQLARAYGFRVCSREG